MTAGEIIKAIREGTWTRQEARDILAAAEDISEVDEDYSEDNDE